MPPDSDTLRTKTSDKPRDMPTVIKHLRLKAAKEHTCNYCGCEIPKGQRYYRDTLVYDGVLYEWKSHIECFEVASMLNMFDDCDDGVSPDDFNEHVFSYLESHFRGEDDELPAELDSLDLYGKVKHIIDTWNRPDFVLRRKKADLERLRRYASSKYSRTDISDKIARLEKEIKELEQNSQNG